MADPVLTCDSCGGNTRKPAIDIGLGVVCPRCCRADGFALGLFPGEFNPMRTYEEWKRLAAEAQAEARNAA